MGRIGTGELILILIIALIIVGPSKLPELGKVMGKTLNEFKKFSKDIKEDLSLDDKPKSVEKVEKVESVEKVEKVETVETAKKNDDYEKNEDDDK